MTREEFKSCYDQYFDPVRNYLYYRSGDAELATDLAQEAFLKVWEKGIQFEAGRTKGLIYKIASDLFVSSVRRNKVSDQYLNKLELSAKSESPHQSLEFRELQQQYEAALGQLPEKQRVTFLMSRMEELTYREIAERLGLSVKAVEKRMSQAIVSLKKSLMQHG